jgi:hypothetical protein
MTNLKNNKKIYVDQVTERVFKMSRGRFVEHTTKFKAIMNLTTPKASAKHQPLFN